MSKQFQIGKRRNHFWAGRPKCVSFFISPQFLLTIKSNSFFLCRANDNHHQSVRNRWLISLFWRKDSVISKHIYYIGAKNDQSFNINIVTQFKSWESGSLSVIRNISVSKKNLQARGVVSVSTWVRVGVPLCVSVTNIIEAILTRKVPAVQNVHWQWIYRRAGHLGFAGLQWS